MLAAQDSDWFSPSQSSFMINYRVDNMEEMLKQLRAGGIAIQQGPESHENGSRVRLNSPSVLPISLRTPPSAQLDRL